MTNRKQTKNTRRVLMDGACYLLGGLCFGAAVSVFTEPSRIAPGGLTGLAVLIGFLTGLPTGTVVLVLNLPLLVLAFRRMGRDFFLRTVAGLLISSVAIDLSPLFLPAFAADRLLSAVFGGVLTGVGLGLIYRRGGSTGGAEIVAVWLRRFMHLSIGRMMLLLDAVVIALSALVYREMESALYAAVTVFLSAQVMDRLVYGSHTAKVALVVSRRWRQINERILREMRRGVTLLDATGGYTGEEGKVLLCAVGRTEVYRLRQLVQEEDPDAFVLFGTAEEVLGDGFGERPSSEKPPKRISEK